MTYPPSVPMLTTEQAAAACRAGGRPDLAEAVERLAAQCDQLAGFRPALQAA